jgi:hypothetical protein
MHDKCLDFVSPFMKKNQLVFMKVCLLQFRDNI